MKPIFKYNGNAGNDFSVLDAYLNEKRPSAKIHFLKIVAYSGLTAIGNNKWPLSNPF